MPTGLFADFFGFGFGAMRGRFGGCFGAFVLTRSEAEESSHQNSKGQTEVWFLNHRCPNENFSVKIQ